MKQLRTTILPTSVIDLEAQTKNKNKRKKGEGAFNDSSRKVMSHHPKETCLMVYELFLRDATHVFDPFAGFGQRAFYAKELGVKYTGYDCSQENIDHAKKEYGVDNILADSLAESPLDFDAVYSCPPYWNLEVYEGGKVGGDKIKTWSGFLSWYESVMAKVVEAMPKGGRICLQVGDWRKNRKYYDLTFQTEKIFDKLNLTPFDKVVRMGYTVKVHETLLVYEKC
jgi:tRNA G10  N-methylase Trm11